MNAAVREDLYSPSETIMWYRYSSTDYNKWPIALSQKQFNKLKRSIDYYLQSGDIYPGKFGLIEWRDCSVDGCGKKTNKKLAERHWNLSYCFPHAVEHGPYTAADLWKLIDEVDK